MKYNKILSIIIIIALSTIIAFAYNASTNLSLRLLEATDDIRPFREDFNYNFELVDDLFDDVSLIEFGYLDGVTSAIQTQLDSKTPKTQEEIEDYAGGMFTGNTETGITLTYQDADGTVDVIIGANNIVESMLKFVDSPADEDIFTYESTTGDFEWHTKAELGIGTATVITDGLILEVDLNADEEPVDNDILTFDTTGDNFSWQTLAELGIAASGANTDITSIYNISLKFGRDADNLIDFTTDNKIVFRTSAVNRMEIISTGELDMNAHGVGFTLGTATGDGATLINWQAGLKFKFTFGAQNETITFTDPSNPCSLLLIIVQDGTGSRTITWSGMTIKWPDGTVITLSTGANTEDAVGFFWDGTSYYAVGTNAFATP